MLLRTKLQAMFGLAITLPTIGETTVSKDGIIEVEDEEIASMLLNGENWTQCDVIEEDDTYEEEEDENDDENDQDEEEDTEEDLEDDEEEDDGQLSDEEKILKAVETMSLEDMIQMAKDSKLSGYNLFKKDEKKMRVFLAKKLQTK